MSILFLLASIGVINGVLLSFYLIFQKQGSISDLYFGGLLLTLCIRIGKSVFFYFNRDADQLILQIGLSACVLIGPFFYLYIKSLYQSQTQHSRKDLSILIALLFLIIAVGIVFPYRTYPEIWNTYVVRSIYGIWMAFVIMGLYYFIQIRRFNKAVVHNKTYLFIIVLAMLFITITYQLALYIGITYIWGALIFSFTFYFLAARLIFKWQPVTPKAIIPPLKDGEVLLKQLNKLMEEQKLYTNQKLKLEGLANQMGISKHLLSRVLNETYHNGFSHYIRDFRVHEAKALIKTRPELSLEGIGYEAGFNSRSAFYDAFKKTVHCTPAEFKKQL